MNSNLKLLLPVSIIAGCLFYLSGCNDPAATVGDVNDTFWDLIHDPKNDDYYYFDSKNGDDGNTGRTEDAPWASLSMLATIDKTDRRLIIALKAGSVWNETLVVPHSNSTISKYSTGEDPLINGAITVDSWVSVGGGVYSAIMNVDTASGETLGHVAENDELMPFVVWNTDVVTTFEKSVTWAYSYSPSSNTVYIKPQFDPELSQFDVSVKARGIMAKGLNDVHIQNVAVKGFSKNGIDVSQCYECSITDSFVKNIGGAVEQISGDVFSYGGNGVVVDSSLPEEPYIATVEIEGLHIHNSFSHCVGFSGVSGFIFNVTSSFFRDCGGSGIAVNAGEPSEGSFIPESHLGLSNVVINRLGGNSHNLSLDGSGYGISADATSGIVSKLNVYLDSVIITQAASHAVYLDGALANVHIRRSRFSENAGSGVYVDVIDEEALSLSLLTNIIDNNAGHGLFFDSSATGNGLVSDISSINNTYYNNGGSGIVINKVGGSLDIRNNIFLSDVSSAYVDIESTLTSSEFDNNCYSERPGMIRYQGVSYDSLVEFSAVSSYGFAGVGNAVVRFSEPESGDFSLSPVSDCRLSGTRITGVLTDYLNNDFNDPPSAGAIQYLFE